jgi:hypothetical protein
MRICAASVRAGGVIRGIEVSAAVQSRGGRRRVVIRTARGPAGTILLVLVLMSTGMSVRSDF